MSEADYAGLTVAAPYQLGAPRIAPRDNLNTHVSAVIYEFTGARRDWLTVVELSTYILDLTRRRARGRP